MIGRSLIDFAKSALGGISDHDYWDLFTALDSAACQFCLDTRCTTRTFNYTVPEGFDSGIDVPLPADFLEIFPRDQDNEFFIGYTNPDEDFSSAKFIPAEQFLLNGDDPEIGPPNHFSIHGLMSLGNLNGAASTPARPLAGSVELIDASATFITDEVSPRDEILNIRDDSLGIVEAVPTETSIPVALFNGDTNDFSAGDPYIINRQDRQLLMFDTILEVGASLSIEYVAKPRPVFSLSSSWNIPNTFHRAIAYEGVYRFKADFDFDLERDQHLHNFYLEAVRQHKEQIARRRILKGKRTR